MNKDIPWIIGGAVALVFFAIFETRAICRPATRNTLSKFIYGMGRRWPVSIYFAGVGSGLLIVHIFAHWCPDREVSQL